LLWNIGGQRTFIGTVILILGTPIGRNPDFMVHFETDDNRTGTFDHPVQFYRTEDFLIESVSKFFREGLEAGDNCIMIATAVHRQAVAKQLLNYGLDLRMASITGQYTALDASVMLSHFMAKGLPRPSGFFEVVGSLIPRRAMGHRVRAFGEMVALLLKEGNLQGAIQLEELWNNLGQTHDFSLLCAYPSQEFKKGRGEAALMEVCAQHSRIISQDSVAETVP
jgi:hypothetical protein